MIDGTGGRLEAGLPGLRRARSAVMLGRSHSPHLPMASLLTVVDHPLVQHKLTLMRRRETSTNNFRRMLGEIGALMAYEVTRDMPMQYVDIATPLETMRAPLIDGKKLVFVPILRAGTGLLDGFLTVVPAARVGHIGLYRDPGSLVAVEYYFKMPQHMEERDVIVLDPMLATGNSAVAAVTRLKAMQPRSIRFVCLVAAPEGVRNLGAAHPDVAIYAAAVDRELDSHGYIVPGLGDAGDRIFGTQ
jgi:uracil phosphoribosyltransferase